LAGYLQKKDSGVFGVLNYASQSIQSNPIMQDWLRLKPVVRELTKAEATTCVFVGSSSLCAYDERIGALLADRDCVYCQTLDSLNVYLATMRSRHVHVIFELDSFGGITEVYDALRKVRDTYPKAVVIAVSGSFLVNDFDLERLPLCDVSLRWPVRSKTLEEAFHHADANNKVWNKRLMENANA